MKKISIVMALCLMCVLLTGCGTSVVGVWSAEVQKEVMPNASMDIEFKKDNTFTMKMKAQKQEIEFGGTYELKDKELTMKITSNSMGMKMQGNQESKAALADDGKSFTMEGIVFKRK